MKNILITGGAGFLGVNLTKHLLKDTDVETICVFDNFISSNKNDFEKIFNDEKRVILYEFDITDVKNMKFVKLNFKFDEIYHLASIASPVFYKKYPLETLNVGFIGTKNILEIARYQSYVGKGYTQNRKVKVLFSSTSEVYGNPEISPQHENYYGNSNSFGERSCYDESKRVAESLCYTYIKEFGLDIKIARIFNTYGENMMLNDGRIVTECIRHLINNTTLTIFGDGNQTRSCNYIDNTIDMLIKLMDTNGVNIPVNVGNDIELTVNEIVNTIEKVYQEHFDKECKLKIEYVPLTQNDPLKRQPCLQRNKQILGETKYINIQDGILNTIKYYKLKN